MQIDFEKIIDLSYNVDENSPRELPIDPVRIYDTATIEADGYFESRVDLSGHCATHIDVPCLMYADGFTVAEIPQEKLFGNTVLIDLSDSKYPGDAVTAADLANWTGDNGEIQAGDIVFLRTGMDQRVDQPSFNQKWIGFSEDGAQFLTEKGIKEAQSAGDLMKKNNINIDLVFSSDLQRANDTAEHALKKMDLEQLWEKKNLIKMN